MMASFFQDEQWANSWERRAPLIEHLVPLLMDELRPVAGERILDVGTGLGPAAIAGAVAVAPGGEVHAVDISAPILARARRHAEMAAAANVHFHQGDAQRSRVPGGPFDAAMSLLGVMFFDDPVAAFANVRGQLREGGRFAFLTWAQPRANPLLAEVMLERFAPRPLVAGDWGSFSMSDPVRFARLLSEAGFAGVELARRELRVLVDETVLFDDLMLDVYGVAEERKPAARLHVQGTLRISKASRGISVPLAVNVATGQAAV
jgi:SAM-dependent methyltransferase